MKASVVSKDASDATDIGGLGGRAKGKHADAIAAGIMNVDNFKNGYAAARTEMRAALGL